MSGKGVAAILATCMLATCMAAAGLSPPGAAHAGEPAAESAMAVSVVRAASHCFTDRLAGSGVFAATHAVELRPDRDGLVVGDVFVEVGDSVTKGQLLARLVSSQNAAQTVEIKAPAPGVLIAAGAIVGAYTSATAGDPLFRIAENGGVELKAEILATSLPRLRKGMAAKIHVVGLGDVEGLVASIDDGVDARTQLGTLHLSVKSDPRLHVGSFARAEIDAGQDCGLMVPLSALLFGTDGGVVGTVDSDHVIMRRVTTGLLEGGSIEIRDGLTENDLVIAQAGPFLREGDRVRPVPQNR